MGLSALVFACTPSVGDDVVLGSTQPGPPPAFSSPDAGESVLDASSTTLGLCPSNECPFPLLTCATSTYLCDVNPLIDNDNCGACGNACAGFVPGLGGSFTCLNGTCVLACDPRWPPRVDCDGIPDNGCEAQIGTNEHCSACGDACKSPETCLGGVCQECLPPKVSTECGCVDLMTDDLNCGACGVECDERPAGFPAAPPHAYYGCSQGTCNKLQCDNRENPTRWTDCNGDLQEPNSDGCEVDLMELSEDHCGACGVQCAPGQACGIRDGSNSQLVECLCEPGEVLCGRRGAAVICADFDSHPKHCGGCGRACPVIPAVRHANTVCRAGVCGFSCDPGWADCNGFDHDGCETNVLQDPANCGACGNVCNGGESQACVAGQCVVEDCEEEEAPQ